MRNLGLLVWLIAHRLITPAFTADSVIINEILYKPLEDQPLEFIELYNPTASEIDLSGWAFTSGINYTFPVNTKIACAGYLVAARFPNASEWKSNKGKFLGPYQGRLSDHSERIMLRSPNGQVIDSLNYSDSLPWPRGADGYGPSLERISADLPTDDYHSWRASLTDGGTPGKVNSVAGTYPKPTLLSYQIIPEHPTSADSVQIEVNLDGPELIQQVTLRYETYKSTAYSSVFTIDMKPTYSDIQKVVYQAELPAQTSQTLVRFSWVATLKDGKQVYLPHVAEPRPFESYFVFDHDIPAKLPILWVFPVQTTSLPEKSIRVTGAAILTPDTNSLQLFDGAMLIASRNGQKIRFLKGEEYRGDRTLNLIPESPPAGTTAGAQSPHVEQLSFRLFRDFGVLAPQADWFRVISAGKHTQQILIEQPNESMLRNNGRDDSGNLYKIAYNEPGGYTKVTNVNEGNEDYLELMKSIQTNNATARAKALRKYLVVEEVMNYSVVGVLMSNWDGFFNNMFIFHNPPPVDQWECIPWDLDKTFGNTDSDPMFVEMPLTFPLDGRARIESRSPGPISGPFHKDQEFNDEYLRRVRKALDGLFSISRINELTQEMQDLLLADLDLLEQYTQTPRSKRRQQINAAYDTMRTFIQLRQAYLRKQFPAVAEWSLY